MIVQLEKKLKWPLELGEKKGVRENEHSHQVPRLSESRGRLFRRLIYLTTSCQVMLLFCVVLIQLLQVQLVKGQQEQQALAESSNSALSSLDLVRLSSLSSDGKEEDGKGYKQLIALQAQPTIQAASLSGDKMLITPEAPESDSQPLAGARMQKVKAIGEKLYHMTDMQVSGAKHPPVYMSAPKQITALQEITKGTEVVKSSGAGHHQGASATGASAEPKAKAWQEIEPKKPEKSSSETETETDLHTAAMQHEKKRRPKKRKKQKRIVKKAVIKKAKKKKKKNPKYIKKVVVKASRLYEPQSPEPVVPLSLKHGEIGKYYEYREVPKKGAWNFGYKRGNSKHTIQRKEHGHKSHFKTEVKWADQKGKGHHLFDYSHADHEAKKEKHEPLGKGYAASFLKVRKSMANK